MANAEIGLIGLGVMGSNLALNIAEKGNRIAVFNRTTEKTHAFHRDAGPLSDMIVPCDTIEELAAAIPVDVPNFSAFPQRIDGPGAIERRPSRRHISARAETSTGAGHDDRLYRIIGIGLVERRDDIGHHPRSESVHPVGSVERDRRDPVFNGIKQGFEGRHDSNPKITDARACAGVRGVPREETYSK